MTQFSYQQPAYQSAGGRSIPGAVATLGVNERVTFIRKTYAHLGLAVAAFVGLVYLWLNPLHDAVAAPLMQWAFSGVNWLLFLGLFIGVSWVANRWALSPTSRGAQYFGLGLYVLALSILFVPLLLVAQYASASRGYDIISVAGFVTLIIFGALTATVFLTKKDFSFLRNTLVMGSFAALGIIVFSLIAGFQLGILFFAAMVLLASGYILFHTSQILAHYHPQAYVAASLALFADVGLLFYYVVLLFLGRR